MNPSSPDSITKRLHVSGLTPSLKPSDLSSRLSSFGTVKALDGFGLNDALGQPRKFGYVTIETTAPKLAKCLNVLSGSTWKGAKLRIGEAKPDYRERIRRENAEYHHPRKKQKRAQGVLSNDMTPVTPENVSSRGGWKVTPLGRIVRPMRMRPLRPIPTPLLVGRTEDRKVEGQEKSRKKKKRIREKDVRARRRIIDPIAFGSSYLKGIFLDVHTPGRGIGAVASMTDGEASKASDLRTTSNVRPTRESSSSSAKEISTELRRDAEEESISIVRESSQEDVSMEDLVEVSSEVKTTHVPSPNPKSQQQVKLKDLFKPREETAGFSLFDLDLDLDLELSNDLQAISFQPLDHREIQRNSEQVRTTLTPVSTSTSIDPTQPLFFPSSSHTKGKNKDVFDMAKEQGWSWRDPSVAFWRTESEEEIRKRWEGCKVELTKDWKKRHREAGKMKKRRGGVDGDSR